MTEREYTAQNIIHLPNFNADETHAVVQQTLTEAQAAGPLPANLTEAAGELRQADAKLLDAMAGRGRAESAAGIDPVRARNADKALDNAWGGTRDWLAAQARLPAEYQVHPESIRVLSERLFADGLGFLTLPFKQEWAESDRRVRIIEEEHLRARFESLHGQLFLKAILDAHWEYGAALHITAAAPYVAPDADIRAPMLECLESLRFYATQVVASVRPRDPSTQARADRLLRPITTWESTHAKPTQTQELAEEEPVG